MHNGYNTKASTEVQMIDAAGNEYIKLDQFLKLAQIAETGGEAKHLILSGEIMVNGTIETRRGRKLYHGDVVVFDGEEMVVEVEADEDDQAEASEANT